MMVKVFFCRKRKECRKKPGNSREKHHEKIICLSERLPPPVGSRAAVQAAGSPDGSVRSNLRQALFDHVQSLSYKELDTLGTNTLITRMTSDVQQVQNGLNLALRLLLRSPFIVFGSMIMAFTIDVRCALIFVVAIPVLSVVVFGIMLVSIPLFRKVQAALDKVLGLTRENLTGVRVIRAFCKEDREVGKFEEANEDGFRRS